MLLSPHSFHASFPNSWDPKDQASLPSRNHTLARRQFYLFKESLGVPSTIFFQCTFLASVEPEEDHTHTSTEQVGCETSQLILLWIRNFTIDSLVNSHFRTLGSRNQGSIFPFGSMEMWRAYTSSCVSSQTLFLEGGEMTNQGFLARESEFSTGCLFYAISHWILKDRSGKLNILLF